MGRAYDPKYSAAILNQLEENGGHTYFFTNDIQARLPTVSSPALSQALKRLEELGLIEKVRHGYWRAIDVQGLLILTARGHTQLNTAQLIQSKSPNDYSIPLFQILVGLQLLRIEENNFIKGLIRMECFPVLQSLLQDVNKALVEGKYPHWEYSAFENIVKNKLVIQPYIQMYGKTLWQQTLERWEAESYDET